MIDVTRWCHAIYAMRVSRSRRSTGGSPVVQCRAVGWVERANRARFSMTSCVAVEKGQESPFR